jgi:hypothetical protein
LTRPSCFVTVTVGIYDYTAAEKGLEGASDDGVILETQVEVEEGSARWTPLISL